MGVLRKNLREHQEALDMLPEMIDKAVQPYVEEFKRLREIFLTRSAETEKLMTVVKQRVK